MLAMLRAVARTNLYRSHVATIRGHRPDDVWHEDDIGWFISFAVDRAEGEEVLLFAVVETVEKKAAVHSAVHLVNEGDGRVRITRDGELREVQRSMTESASDNVRSRMTRET